MSTLTCAPTSVQSNGSTVCTLGLSQPAPSALVAAASSNLNTLTVPVLFNHRLWSDRRVIQRDCRHDYDHRGGNHISHA